MLMLLLVVSLVLLLFNCPEHRTFTSSNTLDTFNFDNTSKHNLSTLVEWSWNANCGQDSN